MYAHRLIERIEGTKRILTDTQKAIALCKRRNGGLVPFHVQMDTLKRMNEYQYDKTVNGKKFKNFSELEKDIATDIDILDAYVSAITRAEKFEISVDEMFPHDKDDEIHEEVDATIALLAESDVLTMPYPLTYVEFALKHDANGKTYRFGALIYQENGSEIKFRAFSSVLSPGDKGWGTYHATGLEVFDHKLPSDFVRNLPAGSRSPEVTLSNLVMVCLKWFIFITTARGTSYVKYGRPDRLNKARVKRREQPIDGYTKVLLPGYADRLKNGTAESIVSTGDGRVVEERKRPRLHWRRAHVRNQAYGKDRKLHKPVLIAAQMIGHEEDGTIYHLQYGQEITQEMFNEVV